MDYLLRMAVEIYLGFSDGAWPGNVECVRVWDEMGRKDIPPGNILQTVGVAVSMAMEHEMEVSRFLTVLRFCSTTHTVAGLLESSLLRTVLSASLLLCSWRHGMYLGRSWPHTPVAP